MAEIKGREALEHKARAFSGSNPEDTFCEGVIIAYCPVPMYNIRRKDGTNIWWRADLVEVFDETVPPQEQVRKAAMGAHYIIYEGTPQGLSSREGVCYCGAHFHELNPVYGTLGELFAAHVRGVRADEERKRTDR